MKQKITILIVDDHQFFRNSLKLFISKKSKYEIIGEAKNGEEFLKFLEKQLPDIVLMDIEMPKINGVEATRIVKNYFGSQVKIIALSLFQDFYKIKEIIDAGAYGYLNKDNLTNHLELAISTVLKGKLYVRDKELPNKTIINESKT